ncbi:SURF1 family protein [Cupriavidus gilardii]|uniref:SURF1 family protein n=1 Tax=Cupriavidus gilardii TaxID=82541 RepID=UPI003D767943
MTSPRPVKHSPDRKPVPRSPATLAVLALLAVLAFAGLFSLGTWQVERRAWKLDLIERVEARVHAPPVDAPAPERWPLISAAADEYRHVRVTGIFLHERETLVQAATSLGGGFWVMTPMRMRDGTVVLINRGFVPQEYRGRETRAVNEPAGETTVTGLLRISQPGGGFLRSNDPATERWYSRDVQAIAAARGLERVAPYFIDADAGPQETSSVPGTPDAPRRWPVGGLTVVTFHNSHLVYALTWYGLALMVLGAAWYVGREELRLRRGR